MGKLFTFTAPYSIFHLLFVLLKIDMDFHLSLRKKSGIYSPDHFFPLNSTTMGCLDILIILVRDLIQLI